MNIKDAYPGQLVAVIPDYNPLVSFITIYPAKIIALTTGGGHGVTHEVELRGGPLDTKRISIGSRKIIGPWNAERDQERWEKAVASYEGRHAAQLKVEVEKALDEERAEEFVQLLRMFIPPESLDDDLMQHVRTSRAYRNTIKGLGNSYTISEDIVEAIAPILRAEIRRTYE